MSQRDRFCYRVREAIYTCMDKHYPDEESRPMVLPVEWRAGLILDDGITDYVTLPKMSAMRSALNSTAMDVMYYQSPLYRNEVNFFSITSLFKLLQLQQIYFFDYALSIAFIAQLNCFITTNVC